MKLETFFEKFETFADAPDAVAKMRELILELAVTGKLFGTEGWEDSTFGAVCERIHYGYTAKANHAVDSVRLLRITDIQNNRVAWDEVPGCHITDKELPKYLLKNGDILIARTGGTVGKSFLVTGIPPTAVFASYLIRLVPSRVVIPDYLKRFLESPSYWLQLFAGARGAAQPNVNGQTLGQISIPLPPLAEQKRIVAKVDELMALCDLLEAQQREREEQGRALVRASLARFAEAPTPANLDYLFHKSYAIPPPDLRKSILTLAVQGKLVPQDPNDEPALALLDDIAALKATLAEDGKLRGSTDVKPMAEDEAKFEIPSTWCWVRFGEIMVNRDGERIPVSKEERETKAKTYDYYGASGVIDKIDGYLFDKPLLLIGEDGANLINRSTPIAFIARGQYWVNNHAHVLDGISEDFLRFIELHVNAISLEPYVTGSAQPKMNQAKMNSIPIALPPLAEQRRIVAKVDELMALVDALETQLTTAHTTAEKVLAAAVAELTHAKEAHAPAEV